MRPRSGRYRSGVSSPFPGVLPRGLAGGNSLLLGPEPARYSRTAEWDPWCGQDGERSESIEVPLFGRWFRSTHDVINSPSYLGLMHLQAHIAGTMPDRQKMPPQRIRTGASS